MMTFDLFCDRTMTTTLEKYFDYGLSGGNSEYSQPLEEVIG
jgi:hypothetical protein